MYYFSCAKPYVFFGWDYRQELRFDFQYSVEELCFPTVYYTVEFVRQNLKFPIAHSTAQIKVGM